MPTSVWTGSLSLGLVVVPVRLYPAVRKKNVRFHELDRAGRRVRHVRVPDRESASPFRILRQALAAADRIAIAWFTLRSRRYLSAIRPYGDVMLLTTMVHANEIAAADFFIPDADSTPTDKELKMARLLI